MRIDSTLLGEQKLVEVDASYLAVAFGNHASLVALDGAVWAKSADTPIDYLCVAGPQFAI